MTFGRLVLGLMVATCLVAGCSKQAPALDTAASKSVNLGTLELTSGQTSRQDLGDGMTCEITATTMDASSLQLIAVLLKAGKQVDSHRMVPVTPDQPLDMSLGNVQLHFTPHVK